MNVNLLSLLISSFVFLTFETTFAQPVNDNCANAKTINFTKNGFDTGSFVSGYSSFTNATVQSGEFFYNILRSSGLNKKSVWFKFTLKTARALRITLMQAGSSISISDVGFTTYFTTGCFPDSTHADSAKLTPINKFGNSYHPCLKPGTYYVQVCAKNNVNDSVQIQIDMGNPKIQNPNINFDKTAYNFGTLSHNSQRSVSFETGCLTIDSANELDCIDTNYAKKITQSAWFTFTTSSTVEWFGLYFRNEYTGGPGPPNSFDKYMYAVLFEGDVKSLGQKGVTQVGDCVQPYLTSSYYYKEYWRDWRCQLKPNTTYSIKLLFHKDFDYQMYLAIKEYGQGKTLSPKPVRSNMNPASFMGVLPKSYAGTTKTLYDYFSCESKLFHSDVQCGTDNMPKKKVTSGSDSSLYNLSTWFRFDTDEKVKINFYINAPTYFTMDIYNDSIDENCGNLDKSKLIYSGAPTTGFNFSLNCFPKGKYSVHLRAMYDTANEPAYSYFWNNKYRNGIGEKVSIQLTTYKIPQENRYSLKDSNAVYLYNGVDSLTALKPNVYQYSAYDTLACSNTLRPERSDSCYYYYPSAVKLNQVSYHQFRIGDYNQDNLPDSGMITINGTYNYNSIPSPYLEFYKGNAKDLAIAQNKWSYPDTLNGLKKIFGCYGIWTYNTNSTRTCVTSGDYTIALRGNENHNGAIVQSNVYFDTSRTRFYSRELAANLGNVSNNIGYYTYALDKFTCLNNPDTISGRAPCGGYTKLLYRQFYISDYRIVRYLANYGSGGYVSLYKGKALDSLVPYKDLSGDWVCRGSMSNTDCDPLPPGWYTAVSYGRGPGFGDGYQYNYDLGQSNYLYLALDTFKQPKFNRPYKANLVNKGFPLNANWKYTSYNNGAANYVGYSKDTCFEFDQYFCLKDSAWMHKYMKDYCDNSYTKVSFYVFRTTATTHMAITGFAYEGSTTAILYDFDVRQDSTKLMSSTPLQSCITDQPNGNYKFCDMKPGWFTLVILARENMNGYTMRPCVRVEPSKVTRNDFAANAYDFDEIRRDSVWVRGKTGDVHPENIKYDPSANWMYCGTSASKSDPYNLTCTNTSILSTGNRAAAKDSNRAMFPYHQVKGDSVYRRNLWYTFVLKGSGKCNVSVDNVTAYPYNNTYDYNTNFSIYESNETGVLNFDSLRQQGRIDSTFAQGLKFIMNNQIPGYSGGYCGYSGYLLNTVTFNKNSCNDTNPKRYYVIVDDLYDYQYFNGPYHYPFQTKMLRMEVKYDGDPNGKVKYDHYSHANVINGLKKPTAPYKDSVLGQGTYAGALGHFECTTKDATDQNSCGTRTIWYKFKVGGTGLIRISYDKGDGTKRYYEDYYNRSEFKLFRSVIDGDSTSNGLKEIPYSREYYNGGYWWENCITEGTYYLMFTGCNMGDVNSITPYVQLIDHVGDRCGSPQDVNISGSGTFSNTVLVDCHTIGNDWGENGKNTGCLNGPTGYKSSWFKINITDTFKYDLTFKMSENTNAIASAFGYRLLIGNCIAFSTGPCNKDLLTQFTINCMKAGTYFIQVFSPVNAVGTIKCDVVAVKTTDQKCKPIYDDPVLAAFIPDIKCKRDTVYFTNYSSRNKYTHYLWKTGYNNYTDTNRHIFFVYPKNDSVKTYKVWLYVTDTLSKNTDSVEQDITIYPYKKDFLGHDTTICSGNSVSLSALYPGASAYLWDNSSTSPTRLVDTAGTYIARVTYGDIPCVLADTVTISFATLSIPHLRDTSVCPGDSVSFNMPVAGATFKWKNNTTDSSIRLTNTNGYIWVDVNKNGCVARDSIYINLKNRPNINLPQDSAFCAGDSLRLDYSGLSDITNMVWNGNYASKSITFSSPGTYRVNFKSITTGCKNADTISVTETPLPVVSIPDSSFCKGDSVSYNIGSAYDAHTWYNNSTSNNITIRSQGKYWIRVAKNKCFQTDTFRLTEKSLPVYSLGKDTGTCLSQYTIRGPKGAYTYLWNNNSTADTLNVNSIGPYTLRIRHNTTLCYYKDTVNISFYNTPQPNIIIDSSNYCARGNVFRFASNPLLTGERTSFMWTFSDTSSSTDSSLNKSFSHAGSFKVKLKVTSIHQCKDSAEKIVNVYPMPVARFAFNDSTQCFKSHSIALTNNSTVASGSNTYLWRFGDNTTSTSTSPTKSYAVYGNYNIRLIVTSNKLCRDSISKPVEIYPMPVAKFAINDSTQCFKLHSIGLTNNSAVATGSNTYLWRFGDNSTSTISNPSKSYATYGNYNIRLVVTTDKSCTDSISKPVEIYPMPVAKFDINDSTQCIRAHSFVMTNKSTVATGSNTYVWRFGDNTSSTLTNPSKSYAVYGNYIMRQVATTDKLCTDSTTKPVEVYRMPIAKFSVNDSTQCFKGHLIGITNNSTIATGTNTFVWRFGDNTSSTTISPGKTYSTYGNYIIKLVATSDKQCTDSVTKPIEIYPMPVAKFVIDDSTQCFKGHAIKLTNNSTVAAGSNSYLWRFGDNTTSSTASPTKTYAVYGNYTIRLTVTTDQLCKDSLTQYAEIYPMPLVKFAINDSTQCYKGHSIVLTNNSSVGTGSNSYLWRFGDNTTSSTTNPSKTYASFGNYTIRLVVTTDKFCNDSLNMPVEVYPMPVAKFSVNDSTQCFKGHSIALTNNSTLASGSNSYTWRFGDNTGSTSASPVKTYSVFGNYTISLLATTDKLCNDSIIKPIEVYPMPVAKFSVNDSTQCFKGHNMALTNNSAVATGSNNYQWRFGDNTGSSVTSPNKTYAVYGNYNIWLVTTTDKSCNDSMMKPVEVYPMPVIKFSVNDSTQCFRNNLFNFGNQSSVGSGSNTYLWRFGDSTTTNTSAASKTYTSYGNYQVTLVAATDKSCLDSLSKPVEVYAMPVVKFSINDSTQCFRGHAMVLSNTSSVATGNNSYLWQFGDNSTSSSASLSKTYTSYGHYNIKLVVTTDKSCNDSASKPVEVYPMPAVKFSVNDSTQCFKGHSIVLNNNSSVAAGSNTYVWTFGDSTSSSSSNQVKTYARFGNYNIQLLATTDKLCVDSIIKPVEVYPMPVAKFSVNDSTQCYKGHAIVLSNNSSVATGNNSYLWRFGDNNTSTSASLSKTYASYGNYIIKLVVTTDKSCTDSASKPVEVYPMPSVAFAINDSTQCFKAHSIALTNQSNVATGSNSFTWRFGDNTSSASASPSKTYATYGNYNIRLVALTDKSCTDSLSKPVEVYPMPVAKFNINDSTQCYKNHSFKLTNTSTIATGSNTYLWKFSDNSTFTNPNPAKTFSAYGNYTVRLVVTSNKLCTDSVEKPVELYPMPDLKFAINDSTQCFKGHNIVLVNNSSVGSGTISYIWRFGDNTSTTLLNPNKTYSNYGNYNIRLVATTDMLCKDSVSKPVEIYASPNVKFTINDSTQCFKNHNVVFTNASTIAAGTLSYTWKFGDNTSVTTANASKTYATFGNYNVRLVVNSDKSCNDSINKLVEIYPMPSVRFGINDSTQCFKGHSLTFTNQSTVGNGSNTYLWRFGDKTTSTVTSPTKTYTVFGNYFVRLVTTTDKLCKDSLQKPVEVYPMPVAQFVINDSTQCFRGHNMILTNQSTVATGSSNYQWKFGDNTVSVLDNPAKQYSAYGNYTIKLIATTLKLCKDSTSKPVEVYPMPVSRFAVNDSTQCFRGHAFTFTNNSSLVSGTMTYSWKFGDTTTSTGTNTKKSYTTAGNYTVKLIAISDKNCNDTLSKPVEVHYMPVADYMIDKSQQCFNNNLFSFTAKAQTTPVSVTSYKWDFGDLTASNGNNVTHHYTKSDSFKVSLMLGSDKNCNDTGIQMVYVYPHPVAKISANTEQLCFRNHQFILDDASSISSGSLGSNLWTLPDLSTVNNQDPLIQSFAQAGTYKMKLRANSDKGCTADDSVTLTVHPQPKVDLLVDNDTQCLNNNAFIYQGKATVSTGSISKWEWQFGDNTNDNVQNPTAKKYAASGFYKVSVNVLSDKNCGDTALTDVYVAPMPEPDFRGDTVCLRELVKFHNYSKISEGTIVKYSWNFGDDESDNVFEPSHLYKDIQTYDVSLTATSALGCSQTISKLKAVSIESLPDVNFAYYNTYAFENNSQWQFRGASNSNIDLWNWNFGNKFNSNLQNPLLDLTDTMSFMTTLTVTSTSGCSNYVSKWLTFYPEPTLFIPNAFSPQNDGTNDMFKPVGIGYMYKYTFQIYNRWGEKLFETNDPLKGWDGYYQGEKVQEGAYLYVIQGTNIAGKWITYKGTVTLLR